MVRAEPVPVRERPRLDLRHRQLRAGRSTARWRWPVRGKLADTKEEAKARGKRLGMGIGSYVCVAGVGPSPRMGREGLIGSTWASAVVRVHQTGDVTVVTGSQPHGQGQITTFSQIIAQELGVGMERIEIRHSDTDGVPFGQGSYGSRTFSVEGAVIYQAAQAIKAKALQRRRLHARRPLKTTSCSRTARCRSRRTRRRARRCRTSRSWLWFAWDLPPGVEPGLEATEYFDPSDFNFPFGSHVAIVEVDEETGAVEVVKYVCVDDVGNVGNSRIVEGQMHGSVAFGFGPALMEQVVYDDAGNLLTRDLGDLRAAARRAEMPTFELERTVTPTPINGDGRQGCGRRQPTRGGSGHRQRHLRCTVGSRRAAHRHPRHAREDLAGDAEVAMTSAGYAAPTSLSDAVALLSWRTRPRACSRAGAGCSSGRPRGQIASSLLVDLRRVPGLSSIEAVGGGLQIGAMTTLRDPRRERGRPQELRRAGRSGPADGRCAGEEPCHGRRKPAAAATGDTDIAALLIALGAVCRGHRAGRARAAAAVRGCAGRPRSTRGEVITSRDAACARSEQRRRVRNAAPPGDADAAGRRGGVRVRWPPTARLPLCASAWSAPRPALRGCASVEQALQGQTATGADAVKAAAADAPARASPVRGDLFGSARVPKPSRPRADAHARSRAPRRPSRDSTTAQPARAAGDHPPARSTIRDQEEHVATTPGRKFFDEHMALIGAGKLDEMIDTQYTLDCLHISPWDIIPGTPPPHILRGREELKKFFHIYMRRRARSTSSRSTTSPKRTTRSPSRPSSPRTPAAGSWATRGTCETARSPSTTASATSSVSQPHRGNRQKAGHPQGARPFSRLVSSRVRRGGFSNPPTSSGLKTRRYVRERRTDATTAQIRN